MATKGKRKPYFLWMQVSNDEYELPLYVADTAKELAEFAGGKKPNIHHSSCVPCGATWWLEQVRKSSDRRNTGRGCIEKNEKNEKEHKNISNHLLNNFAFRMHKMHQYKLQKCQSKNHR